MTSVKKTISLITAALLVFLLAACGSASSGTSAGASGQGSSETSEASSAELLPLRHAEIEIEGCGTVKLELDPNEAPLTVANFVKLAEEGFYDGLTFHRIMNGFMIQGGDPNGNGTGGASENITGEFAANGIPNAIQHKKGVISMARAKDPNSASSQFFIMVGDADYLDGQYAAFGWVTEGQDIVDRIAAEAEPIDSNGTIPAEKQPVITRITVTD